MRPRTRRRALGGVETHDVGGVPNAMAFDREGGIWICDFETDAVQRYDPDTRESGVVADAVDGGTLDKPNDLAFDAEGNLVFTCSGDPGGLTSRGTLCGPRSLRSLPASRCRGPASPPALSIPPDAYSNSCESVLDRSHAVVRSSE